jgi:flagellar basal-body rod modification protein FlgD
VLRTWQVSWEPLVDTILVSCNAIRPARGDVCRMQVRVERAGRAVVEVHDAAGQRVKTLLDGEVGAGAQLVAWDGRAEDGAVVAAGGYFVNARVPGGRRVVRVAVLR